MSKASSKPLLIPAIPATAVPHTTRPMSLKRLSRVRISWFVVGCVFGIGVSFFMSFVITMVIIPEYETVMARHGDLQIAEAGKSAPLSPIVAILEKPVTPITVKPATQVVVASAPPIPPAAATPEYKNRLSAMVASLMTALPSMHSKAVAPASAVVMASASVAPSPVTAARTVAPALVTASTTSPATAAVTTATPPSAPPKADEITYPRTLAIELRKGETLLSMLIANHVQAAEAHQVIAALKPQLNAQTLKPGQKISVTLARHETLGDKAAVKELAINLPNLSTVELQRLDSGKFNVDTTKEALTAHAYRGFAKVRTSIYQAGTDANIPNLAMNEIVKAFSYDVDFQREIHPGDTLEVLMDRKTAKDGRVGGYEGVRYAALTLRGTKHEIFRAKDMNNQFAWVDRNGNSVKKSLLRTPVAAVHITSGFGMRMHPLLGYTKFHRGVDFGAASGTPIMAAGDGVVEFKGWKTGYGNFVLLKHNNTYETAYGHISRFANIQVGGRVKQGQVIAFVGMTGMATGPHLHYEVRQNDEQVDPVSKQFNMASGLSGKQLTAFNASKKAMLNELAGLNKPAATVAAATPSKSPSAQVASR